MKKSEILKNSDMWKTWQDIDASDDIYMLAPSIKAREKMLWRIDNEWSVEILSTLVEANMIDMSTLGLLLDDDGAFYDFVDDFVFNVDDRNLRRCIELKDSNWAGIMPYLDNILKSAPNSDALKKMLSYQMNKACKLTIMSYRISGRWNLHYTIPPFYKDILSIFTQEHLIHSLKDWKNLIAEFGKLDGVLLALYAHRCGKAPFNDNHIFNYAQEHQVWNDLTEKHIEYISEIGLYFNDTRYPLDSILEKCLQQNFVRTIQNFQAFFHHKTVEYLLAHGHEGNCHRAFERAYKVHTGKELTDMAFCKYIAEQGGYVLKEVRARWKTAHEMMSMGVTTSPFPLSLSSDIKEEISIML